MTFAQPQVEFAEYKGDFFAAIVDLNMPDAPDAPDGEVVDGTLEKSYQPLP